MIQLLIERFDPIVAAQGAALGAVAGYLCVFVIRAINAQKYVKFNVQPFKLIVNTILVSLQTAIMIFEINGWIYYQVCIFAIIVLFNIKPIISGIMPIIRKILGKLHIKQNN